MRVVPPHVVDPQQLIEALKSDSGASSLAALSIDAILEQPVDHLLPADEVVAGTRAVLEAWLASPEALDELSRVVERLATVLKSEHRPLKDVTWPEVRRAVREIIERPFSPDRKLVLTIIDRPPMRALVRQLLLNAVLDFGRKASAPVAGVARGLGSLAKFAGDTMKSRTGGLGSFVGAVSGEVERQVEKRAVEFVDASLAAVFGQIADAISDPKRADEAAEMRVAIFDGVLDLTGPQLSRELINADVRGGAELLRSGITRWLSTEASTLEMQKLATYLLAEDATRPVKDVLARVGLLDVTKELAVKALTRQLKLVAEAPALAAWLAKI